VRIAALLTVVLIAALVLVPLFGRRPAEERPADSARTDSAGQPAPAASGSELLREKLLSREMLRDMPPDPDGDGIRAVVFDWGMGDGGATLVAFDDGTTSLYFTGGGGIIGAGAHDAVRRAAASFREEAARLKPRLTRADAFPPPTGERSVFYVVTDSATLTSGPISNADLERGRPPFGELGTRAQAVITEIRKAS
jgi:hypothetical protein